MASGAGELWGIVASYTLEDAQDAPRQLPYPRVTSILVPTTRALQDSQCWPLVKLRSVMAGSAQGACLEAAGWAHGPVLHASRLSAASLLPLQTNSGPGPFADFLRTLQTQHRNDFLCNISQCPPISKPLPSLTGFLNLFSMRFYCLSSASLRIPEGRP